MTNTKQLIKATFLSLTCAILFATTQVKAENLISDADIMSEETWEHVIQKLHSCIIVQESKVQTRLISVSECLPPSGVIHNAFRTPSFYRQTKFYKKTAKLKEIILVDTCSNKISTTKKYIFQSNLELEVNQEAFETNSEIELYNSSDAATTYMMNRCNAYRSTLIAN